MEADPGGMQQVTSVLMLLVGLALMIMSALPELKMVKLFSVVRRPATRLERAALFVAGVTAWVVGTWRLAPWVHSSGEGGGVSQEHPEARSRATQPGASGSHAASQLIRRIRSQTNNRR